MTLVPWRDDHGHPFGRDGFLVETTMIRLSLHRKEDDYELIRSSEVSHMSALKKALNQ